MVKKFQWKLKTLYYYASENSEDDTMCTTSKIVKLKNLSWILILKRNCVNRRGKSVPKKSCGYFSHPLDVYEVSPGRSPWTSKYL